MKNRFSAIQKIAGIITIAVIIGFSLAGCASSPTYDSVDITAEGNKTELKAGETLQFSSVVKGSVSKDGKHEPSQKVTWKVSSTADMRGEVTSGTSISGSGKLTVTVNEVYPILYVTATTEGFLGAKQDKKEIQVSGPRTGAVKIGADVPTAIAAGGNAQLSATSAGKAPNQGITWSVSSKNDGTGAVTTGTSISETGLLTVSINETASSIFVIAAPGSEIEKADTKEIKIVTVTSVTVKAADSNKVLKGGTVQFNATVVGNNGPANTVTWKVSSNSAGTGTVAAGTKISETGLLTVAADETYSTLYVTATSTVNTSKSGSATALIPTVSKVTISPTNPSIKRGEGVTFKATVSGTNGPSQEVTWTLEGIGGTATTVITSNGMVIIDKSETLSRLSVSATSVQDPTKEGSVTITIPAAPAAVPK